MKKIVFAFFALALFSMSSLPVYAVVANPSVNLDQYLADLKKLRMEQYAKNAARGGKPAVLGVSTNRQQSALGIYKTVRFGQKKSEDVKRLQTFLIAKGYLKVEASGNFLTQTKIALKKFQVEYDITGGDGTIAGPKTNAKIMSISQ